GIPSASSCSIQHRSARRHTHIGMPRALTATSACGKPHSPELPIASPPDFRRRCRKQSGRGAPAPARFDRRYPTQPYRAQSAAASRKAGSDPEVGTCQRAGTRPWSNVEGLTATAAVLFPRIVELEPLVQAFAREIKFSAVDVRQALGVNEDLDTMTFELTILGLCNVRVFQLVRHARAAGRAYTQPQSDAATAFGEITRNVLRCALGHRHTHHGAFTHAACFSTGFCSTLPCLVR